MTLGRLVIDGQGFRRLRPPEPEYRADSSRVLCALIVAYGREIAANHGTDPKPLLAQCVGVVDGNSAGMGAWDSGTGDSSAGTAGAVGVVPGGGGSCFALLVN